MPNKAAHAGLRLTASRGVPTGGAAEPQPPDCGCHQAVHITLQTAWTAISRADCDMNGLVAHSRLPPSWATATQTQSTDNQSVGPSQGFQVLPLPTWTLSSSADWNQVCWPMRRGRVEQRATMAPSRASQSWTSRCGCS